MGEQEQITNVANAARRFLQAYDEFFPDYPPAVAEPLERLTIAVDALGNDVNTSLEVPDPVPYHSCSGINAQNCGAGPLR
jgi:hypothetical protein